MFLTIKTLSQNISITLLQISLKLHEHRGRYWMKKLPWTILEEQFPVPRYTAASKIGNGVISISLRCHCNLIITSFHLYLIQLCWPFFQIFVCSNVVYAQTWEVLTLKNCIEPPYANDLTFSLASVQYTLATFEVVAFTSWTCRNAALQKRGILCSTILCDRLLAEGL